MRNFEASIPVGFFTYPISQAADITAFKADYGAGRRGSDAYAGTDEGNRTQI